MDCIADESEWRDRADGRQASLVKDAYLNSIPWNSMEDRLRAWDLGERVGRILSVYESEQLNDALQRRDRLGGNIAMLLANALNCWESVRE